MSRLRADRRDVPAGSSWIFGLPADPPRYLQVRRDPSQDGAGPRRPPQPLVGVVDCDPEWGCREGRRRQGPRLNRDVVTRSHEGLELGGRRRPDELEAGVPAAADVLHRQPTWQVPDAEDA